MGGRAPKGFCCAVGAPARVPVRAARVLPDRRALRCGCTRGVLRGVDWRAHGRVCVGDEGEEGKSARRGEGRGEGCAAGRSAEGAKARVEERGDEMHRELVVIPLASRATRLRETREGRRRAAQALRGEARGRAAARLAPAASPPAPASRLFLHFGHSQVSLRSLRPHTAPPATTPVPRRPSSTRA